jgi:hypothetical protein
MARVPAQTKKRVGLTQKGIEISNFKLSWIDLIQRLPFQGQKI